VVLYQPIVLVAYSLINEHRTDPRSRSLTELIDFMREGRCIPRVIKTECVTEQQVMGLDTIYLLDLLIIYP
jgi:hypothetical protein